MKEIALKEKHEELGAKMVPFAGYNMPLQYTGVTDEHIAVRENVGVFDVSHMGEFIINGKGAKELVQYVTSNDVNKLFPGKIQYSCLPNEKGGIVDDLLVYMLDENSYMLVVNASNIEKDWEWISQYNKWGAEMENISDQTCLLAVQGPKAKKALQPLTDMDLENMKYYTFEKGEFAGVDNVLVSATGYTGAGGFEIYFDNKHADKVWDAILEAGKDCLIRPAGLAARDTLRLEMGFCLYGNDIDDTTSPIEAGLGWVTKFKDAFINMEGLKKQKEEGVLRRLVGFEMVDKGIPRKGYKIYNTDEEEIGEVTSGTMGPSVKKGIGMGYVKTAYSKPDTELLIGVRKKMLKAKIVKPPFYKSKK